MTIVLITLQQNLIILRNSNYTNNIYSYVIAVTLINTQKAYCRTHNSKLSPSFCI